LYQQQWIIMNLLSKDPITIKIHAKETEVISTFLRVFLANERLTDKQLEVTTELVTKYAEYVTNGVVEPYASTLLFATDTRKMICKNLSISAAHLNNTFNALTEKNILAREDKKYSINPSILPSVRLTFEFSINAK
jgi:hypothetical protein